MKTRIQHPSRLVTTTLALLGLAIWVFVVYWATNAGGPVR